LIGKYLNTIEDEYARKFSAFSGEPPTQKLNYLTDLKEFIADFKDESPFDIKFKKPFHDVIKALQELIIA
jgi:hypothetical protein